MNTAALVLALVAALLCADANGAWTRADSKTKLTLNSCKIKGAGQTMLAVGDDGAIIMSEDYGNSFRKLQTRTTAKLMSVFFTVNGQDKVEKMWAAGQQGLIITSSDDGNTFSMVSSNGVVTPSSDIYEMERDEFTSHILMGTSGGTVFKTTDFNSFQRQGNAAVGTVRSIKCFSEVCWAASEDGKVYKTHDGGESWAVVYATAPAKRLFCVHTDDMQKVMVTGEDGTMLHSVNGGTDWTEVSVNSAASLYGCAGAPGLWFAVGDSGTILRSSNAGLSWTIEPSGTKATLKSVDMAPSNKVSIICGIGGVVMLNESPDLLGPPVELSPTAKLAPGQDGSVAGDGWKLIPTGAKEIIYDIITRGPQSKLMVLTGENGLLLTSEDHGATFKRAVTNTKQPLYTSLFTVDGKKENDMKIKSLWAFGGDGTMVGSANGGETFGIVSDTSQQIGHSTLLNVVRDATTEKHIMGASNGQVYYSTDLEYWKGMAKAGSGNMNQVACVGYVCVVVSSDGRIYRSANLGASWVVVHTTTPKRALHALHTDDLAHMVAVGDAGTILKSDDTGVSWVVVEPGTLSDFYAANGAPGIWYIAGESGLAMYSVNNGESWTADHTGQKGNIYAVDISDTKDKVFIVGDGGMLMEKELFVAKKKTEDEAAAPVEVPNGNAEPAVSPPLPHPKP